MASTVVQAAGYERDPVAPAMEHLAFAQPSKSAKLSKLRGWTVGDKRAETHLAT